MNSGTVFLSIILCGKLCHTQAPVPDTTALVTLRDKPLGGNDSMPTVQVRYRIKTCQVVMRYSFEENTYRIFTEISIMVPTYLCDKLCCTQAPVPDTTALVTLRDKPLGGNDSMPIVQVRYRIRICPEIGGDSFKMNTDRIYIAFSFTVQMYLCDELCRLPVPVPDTTALVTLRDKPLGVNDSMPTVQVRYRIKTCREIMIAGLKSIPLTSVRNLVKNRQVNNREKAQKKKFKGKKLNKFLMSYLHKKTYFTDDSDLNLGNNIKLTLTGLEHDFLSQSNILKMLFFNLLIGGQGTGCGTRLQLKLYFWRISGEGLSGALNKLLILDSSSGYGYVTGHHNDNPCGSDVLLFMAFNLRKISGAFFELKCSPITLTGELGTGCGSSPHLELSPSLLDDLHRDSTKL